MSLKLLTSPIFRENEWRYGVATFKLPDTKDSLNKSIQILKDLEEHLPDGENMFGHKLHLQCDLYDGHFIVKVFAYTTTKEKQVVSSFIEMGVEEEAVTSMTQEEVSLFLTEKTISKELISKIAKLSHRSDNTLADIFIKNNFTIK